MKFVVLTDTHFGSEPRGPALRAPPRLPRACADLSAARPPDYSHVTVSGGQIVIHQCSFMYAGPRFSLHDQAALNGALG
ncbi:hypothetical protein ACVJGD_009156 [Bradyrhizobium sp. USDA 10063]